MRVKVEMAHAATIMSVTREMVSWNTLNPGQNVTFIPLPPGDCDNDDQCDGDLVCGEDNCFTEFGWSESLLTDGRTQGHDCCTKKTSKIDGLPFLYGE